jgi:hypothetical protein
MGFGSDATFPQFAAVDKAAHLAFEGVCGLTDEALAEQQGRAVINANEAAYRQVIAAESDARETLAEMPPRSVAGLLAAMDHFREYAAERPRPHSSFSALKSSSGRD